MSTNMDSYRSLTDKFPQFPKGQIFQHVSTQRTPHGDSGLRDSNGAVGAIRSQLLHDPRYFSKVTQQTELQDILFKAAGGISDMAKDEIKQVQLWAYKQTLEIIGPDLPVYINGREVRDGETVTIDTQQNQRESLIFIETNGKNNEKKRARLAARKHYGVEE